MSVVSSSEGTDYAPPSDCPVCGHALATIRLGCHHCGTEVVGDFRPHRYSRLAEADLQLLDVFLAARGNLKEVEKHFGISYPTARLRLTGLLTRLGLVADDDRDGPLNRDQVLAEVARGTITPDEAARLLQGVD